MSWFSRLNAIYQRPVKFHWILFNLAIALVYGITAELSVAFATLPGQVTAVWLPAGLTTALVAFHGRRVLPGIAFGSMVGLLPSLLVMNPPLSLPQLIFLNLVFALADCLQPLVNLDVIKRKSGFRYCR